MTLAFEKDEAWFRERLPAPQEGEALLREIRGTLSARRLQANVLVEGRMTAQLETACSRCLEKAVLPVAASFKYTFAPLPEEPLPEWELTAEDLDFAYYHEDTIELDDILFEQLLLQVPIKPLCAETCRGLCPRCGVNRNLADCSCRDEEGDDRLAVLKTFKVQS